MPNAGAGRWLPLAIVFAMFAAGFAPPCDAAQLVPDSGVRMAPGHPGEGDSRKDQGGEVEVFLGARKVGLLEQAERLKTQGSTSLVTAPSDSVRDYGKGSAKQLSEPLYRCRCLSEAPFRSGAAATIRDYLRN